MIPVPLPIEQVRAEFPSLAQLAYLNTAGAGIAGRDQTSAVARLYKVDLARGDLVRVGPHFYDMALDVAALHTERADQRPVPPKRSASGVPA